MSQLMENADSNSPTQGLTGEPQSFLDKTRARLHNESASSEDATPGQVNLESAEDAAPRKIPVQHEEDDYEEPEASADDEESETESDLYEDEAPEEESPLESSDVNWEQRYKDTQSDYTRLAQERAQEREESAKSIEQNIRLRHALEEKSADVEKHGQFLLSLLNQNVAQYEHLDWDSMPVEQKAQKRREYEMALNSSRQMQNAMTQITAQNQQYAQEAKQREAEVSKEVLRRTIPNWGNEHLMTLRDHAVQNVGFTAEEFDQITDHRLVRLIHDNWDAKQALAKVQEVKRQGKKRAPKRGAKPQERNAQGRFNNAKRNFREGKGSFQDMTAQRLKNERSGGR